LYLAGECFFIDTNLDTNGFIQSHLFVNVFDVVDDDDETILIPIDTIYPDRFYDDTTILEIGDHDYVTRRSYMNYNLGQVRTKVWIDNHCRLREPLVTADIIQRIRYGIEDSEFTPFDVEAEYRKRAG
jgi:hypothetical protein